MGMSIGYLTKDRRADMKLVRSRRSLNKIKSTYHSGGTKKELRSYYLPGYQINIIDLLHEDTAMSKGGVVRSIIDEWIELKLRENGQ